MTNISWKDVAHYGSGVACLAMAGLTEVGVQLPGVTVDPKIAGAAGIGILAAGLKSTPTSGKAVIAFLIAGLALFGEGVGGARAADMKLPVKSPISQFGQPYPTNGCGAYYGFNALASALPIADATPGATAIGGDIGGTLGYTCALANGSSWFLEGQGDLQNLNGTGGNGFHLGGQAHLAIRGGVSGPILTMLPSLPNLNLPAVPSLPILPQGVTASGASQTFIYGAVNFDDISAQFGNAQARDWLISPEIGLENRTRLSNNVVAAVWAGGVLESNPICIGGVACPKLSTGLRTGFQFLY